MTEQRQFADPFNGKIFFQTILWGLVFFFIYFVFHIKTSQFYDMNSFINSVESNQCNGRYIYMYSLPAKLSEDMGRNCKHLIAYTNVCANAGLGPPLADFGGESWYETDQFSSEIIFYERMKKYPCLTTDPEKSLAFYIPYMAGLDLSMHGWDQNLTDRDQSSEDFTSFVRLLNVIQLNHFMVLGRVAWDFTRATNDSKAWGNNLLKHPEMKNVTILSMEIDPRNPHHVGIPYPSHFHPSNFSELQKWQNHIKSVKRKFLFSFAGGSRPGIRENVIKQCNQSERCELMGTRPGQVMELFMESVFCLQPSGDSYTRRSTFDSMLAGCIPVFFHEDSAYTQYRLYLPKVRESYSVFIPQDDVVSRNVSVEEVLMRYSPEETDRMRGVVIEMLPSLVYGDPRQDLDFKDAFDVAIDGILNRARARNHE